MTTAAPREEAPEEKLTSIIALASSVDGIELVVGAHEGLTYAVNAPSEGALVYADELASLSAEYLGSIRSGLAGGRARIALATFSNKALLMADLGEGFTVAILGDRRAVASLLDPVRRIIEGKPLRCPKCGANLDVYTIRCHSCGRRLPFGVRVCPFCGATIEERECPNCGLRLRLHVDRVVEAPAVIKPRPRVAVEGARTVSRRVLIGLKALIMAAVTAVYYLVSLAAGYDLITATLAGLPALAATYTFLLYMDKG